MRLLHRRNDHGGEGAARPQSAAKPGGGAARACRESVSMRDAQPHCPRGLAGGAKRREDLMNAISRRDFVAGLGGITLTFTLAPRFACAQQPAAEPPARLPGSLDTNRLLDAWIRIGTDGNATVCTGKVELGQGIVTALAQIAAEELDLPLDRVQMISGDTEKTPNEGVTAGSQSIENSGIALRLAGAQVRGILVELAAKRLGADAAALSVTEGVIAAPDGRKLSYAELAASADLHREA